jgi:hypothetical protein
MNAAELAERSEQVAGPLFVTAGGIDSGVVRLHWETEHELCTVDRPGAARAHLSVRRWRETGLADRDADEADAAARLVPAVHSRAEVLGALGLVLPGLLRIRPGLTPLAAPGLVIIMTGATVLTLTRDNVAMALMPLVAGLLSTFLAYGAGGCHRFGGRLNRERSSKRTSFTRPESSCIWRS